MSMMVNSARFAAAGGAGIYDYFDTMDLGAAISLTNSNLTATRTGTSNVRSFVQGKTGKASGKWRYQVTVNALPSAELALGFCDVALKDSSYLGADVHSIGWTSAASRIVITGGSSVFTPASTFIAGDVVDVLVDVPNRKVYYAKNGVLLNSANPDAGTGGFAISSMLAAIYPAIWLSGTAAAGGVTVNFGNTAWANTLATATTFTGWTYAAAPVSNTSYRAIGFWMIETGFFGWCIEEWKLRATTGGSDVATGGTTIASGSTGANVIGNARDGNTATFWQYSPVGAAPQPQAFFGYDHGSVASRSATLMFVEARFGTGGEADQVPTRFVIAASDDAGVTWWKIGARQSTTWTATASAPGPSHEFTI